MMGQHDRSEALFYYFRLEKKGGGVVCGTQKSDRTASPAFAEIKVCSRAVLSGSDCAKHQTANPLPPAKKQRKLVRTPGCSNDELSIGSHSSKISHSQAGVIRFGQVINLA